MIAALSVLGLIMVYSASYILSMERSGDGLAFVRKQAVVFLIGWAVLWAASRVRVERLKAWSVGLMIAAVVLLLMVWVPGIGTRVGGAQRWVRLGGLVFQPSEFAKFATLLFVAKFASEVDLRTITWRELGRLGAWISPVVGLLLLQPDFGNAAVLLVTAFLVLFIAGLRPGVVLTLAFSGVLAAMGLVLFAPYRVARVVSFLDPWKDAQGKGFQVIQSLLSFHEGKLWGVGLGHGREKLFYLPEAHNDFLFSVLGEELGFVGVTAVIVVFALLLYRGLKLAWIAYERQRRVDLFGFLVAAGLVSGLALQAFTNIAVVMGLVPTKGLPLPLLSYGGTSLLMSFLALGVMLGVGRVKS